MGRPSKTGANRENGGRPNYLWLLGLLLVLVAASALAQTWTQTSAPITNWTAVASSADGSKVIAATGGCCGPGAIYLSIDSGTGGKFPSLPRRSAISRNLAEINSSKQREWRFLDFSFLFFCFPTAPGDKSALTKPSRWLISAEQRTNVSAPAPEQDEKQWTYARFIHQ